MAFLTFMVEFAAARTAGPLSLRLCSTAAEKLATKASAPQGGTGRRQLRHEEDPRTGNDQAQTQTAENVDCGLTAGSTALST
jgi:hypothetical protein